MNMPDKQKNKPEDNQEEPIEQDLIKSEEILDDTLVLKEASVEDVVLPIVEEEEETDAAKSRRFRPPTRRTEKFAEEASGMIEQVVAIKRITKVTKGGKKLSFSALVVVGDGKGNVGYSLSKASEVSIAIKKAMGVAKKNMVTIPMRGSTIPHQVIGQCGGSRVLLKPASEGTGVIAAGPVRAICDGAGIHNILTKCHRSNNPINVVKATMEGFSRLKTAAQGG